MYILVACEESQAVTKAFRARGHKAFSCDILPCSGDHPEWHLRADVRQFLGREWDMIIAFPPCTDSRRQLIFSCCSRIIPAQKRPSKTP